MTWVYLKIGCRNKEYKTWRKYAAIRPLSCSISILLFNSMLPHHFHSKTLSTPPVFYSPDAKYSLNAPGMYVHILFYVGID